MKEKVQMADIKGAAGPQKAESIIEALTPDQRDRLQDFIGVLLAKKKGALSKADVLHYAANLPPEDIAPFTDFLQAIRK